MLRNIVTSTSFEAERNQVAYFKVCDGAGNCSDQNSTQIRIDKTAPSVSKIENCPTDATYNKCQRFTFSDNFQDETNKLTLYRSTCISGYKTDPVACSVNTAVQRIEYYKSHGNVAISGDNRTIHHNVSSIISSYRDANGHVYDNPYDLSTSFGPYTIDYAIIVCDSAGNCSGTKTHSY